VSRFPVGRSRGATSIAREGARGKPGDTGATARLAAIVESSPNAISALTPNGTIQSWNSAAEILYGYGAAEAVGNPIAMLDAPPHPAISTQVAAAIEGGTLRFSTETATGHRGRV
jgi:PAS domain S-box-containing protein